MRCLQCGKDVPLLKRMSGSEFCSDAHRREYQHEYSQLALGRLLQSKPPGPEKSVEANGSASLLTPAATANGHSAPALSITMPPVQNTEPVVTAYKTSPEPSPVPVKKVEPRHAIPMPPAPAPAKVATDPAVAAIAKVEKPAPAAPQRTNVGTAEFEQALWLKPDRPRHQANVASLALLEASPIPLERGVEMADATMHPIERELELRESARPAPRIDLDLRIMGPESLEAYGQSLVIPVMSSIAPEDAALWTADQRDFSGSLISLGSLASFQLSTTGFEDPGVAAPAPSAAEPQPLPEPPVAEIEIAAAAIESPDVQPAADAHDSAPLVHDTEPRLEGAEAFGEEPQATAAPPGASGTEPSTVGAEPQAQSATHEVQGLNPHPVLEPLPVLVQGIAAGRAKPAQVFGAALFSGKTVQVPQPSGLPLRPLMVLGPVEAVAAPVTGKKRKGDVRILPPAAAKPAQPAAKTPAAPSGEPDPGLPELRLQSPQDADASRMPKIVAAVAGAAVIGLGIFFFLGRSDTASKPAVETSTTSANWISDFATDAKRQRKVSVLRASTGLAAYRLDFESSIQIKGLGWVYRARDAKNYYVSKVELETPGQNPAFVIVHYAVIDGVEQPHAQAPLHVGVPLGGHYKIRFEAVGDRFTTWIQGQQVDQWTDARLTSGGAGLYREGAEQFALHGDFQVTPLAKDK